MKNASSHALTVLVDHKTYRVLCVKEGGMGRVWLLEQEFDEPIDLIYRHRIAVKTFKDETQKERIERELNIWISLAHPFILPLKKIGLLDFHLAAIMPFMTRSLDDVLEQHGSFGEQRIAAIIAGAVSALDYAWDTSKTLHLDLKPSNILLETERSFEIRVADWGISRMAGRGMSQVHTSTGQRGRSEDVAQTSCTAGTPLFMAPERFTSCWELSPVADIYSLGMMAINLSAGVLPFRFEGEDIIEEICSGSYFANAKVLLENGSEEFRNLCLSCIDPNPRRRESKYQNILSKAVGIIARNG